DLSTLAERAPYQAPVLSLARPAAPAGAEARDPRRYPGADRLAVVVPAQAHHRGGDGIHPAAPRCHAVLPHDMDPRRDLLPDDRAPSCARPRNPYAHAHLPDVYRLRNARDFPQRPLRPAAEPGLSLRAQDQPRGA